MVRDGWDRPLACRPLKRLLKVEVGIRIDDDYRGGCRLELDRRELVLPGSEVYGQRHRRFVDVRRPIRGADDCQGNGALSLLVVAVRAGIRRGRLVSEPGRGPRVLTVAGRLYPDAGLDGARVVVIDRDRDLGQGRQRVHAILTVGLRLPRLAHRRS